MQHPLIKTIAHSSVSNIFIPLVYTDSATDPAYSLASSFIREQFSKAKFRPPKGSNYFTR